MTLCLSWFEKKTLIAMSDSRVSAGNEIIDTISKIEVFDSANFFIAWSGYTGYSLPMLKDISLFVSKSPTFSLWGNSSVEQTTGLILDRMNKVWKRFNRDLNSADPEFLVGTYDFDRDHARLFQIVISEKNSKKSTFNMFEKVKTTNNPLGVSEIGSGSGSFNTKLQGQKNLQTQVIKSFISVLEDSSVPCTSGIPHIVSLDRRGVETYGLKKGGDRYHFSSKEDTAFPFPKNLSFFEYENLRSGVMP